MQIFVSLLYYVEGSETVQWPKPIASSSSAQAISDLISRVLDGAPSARLFQVSINPNLAVNGKDVFELSNGSAPGSISISASTGVAAAWGSEDLPTRDGEVALSSSVVRLIRPIDSTSVRSTTTTTGS